MEKNNRVRETEDGYSELGQIQLHLDEPGAEISGIYLGREDTDLEVFLHHFEIDGDKDIVLLGTAGLDKLLTPDMEGCDVKVLLDSITTTRAGFAFKKFRVFKKLKAK